MAPTGAIPETAAAAQRVRGDDVFQSGPDNDTCNGGAGLDTLILSGSVWDYDWSYDNHDRKVDLRVTDLPPDDGDTGEDALTGIEVLQFDGATINLGEEQPMTCVDASPAEFVVKENTVATFTFTVEDLDDNVIDAGLSQGWMDVGWGRLSIRAIYDDGAYKRGPNSLYQTYEWDTARWDEQSDGLAEGERMVVPIQLALFTQNFEFDNMVTGDGQTETYRQWFDLVLVGANDAPTIDTTLDLSFQAVEGAANRFDLSALGADIDSDDDGSTLTYRVVGAEASGLNAGGTSFTVWTEGSEMVVTGDGLPYAFGSDETSTMLVELQAVDRHGAVSAQTVTVEVTIQGIDDTPIIPPYVVPGGFDFSTLPADRIFDFGTERLEGPLENPAAIWPILEYTEGNDTTMIRASSLIWFDAANDIIVDGVTLLDEMRFDTKGGDDVLVFQATGTGQQWAFDNAIATGTGQDTVLFDMRGGSQLRFDLTAIDTGGQSDYVGIVADSTGVSWFSPEINTGGGADVVDIRYTSRATGEAGELWSSAHVDLGTGDDQLTLVYDRATATPLYQGLSISVDADEGDDNIFIDVSGLGASIDIPVVDTPSEIAAELYPGGFNGSIHLDAGADTLELRLNSPSGTQTADATIWGDDRLNLDDAIDTVILSNVSSAQIVATEEIDYYGLETGVEVFLDTGQSLKLYGIEVLTLSDTDNWFA